MSEKNKTLFDEPVLEQKKPEYPELELTRDTVDVPLPSNGLIYDQMHPLHQKSSTSFVELTPFEESVLYDKTRFRNGTVIEDLVQVALHDKTINVNTLLSGDKDVIFAVIRGFCFDEIYKFDIKCPQCETTQEITYNILQQLKYKSLNLDEVKQVAPHTNKFLFTLPKSGYTVEYKYLTVGDTKRVAKDKKDRQKAGMDSKYDLVYDLSSAIISISGITDRAKILEFMTKVSTKDSAAFRRHVMNTEPGLDTMFDFECNNKDCGHKEKTEMKVDASFFFPLLK
jgi:hypothetical protein